MEGSLYMRIFISYILFLPLIYYHNRFQVPCFILFFLGTRSILVHKLISDTLWNPVMPHHHDQTKPLLPCISKYQTVVEVAVDC